MGVLLQPILELEVWLSPCRPRPAEERKPGAGDEACWADAGFPAENPPPCRAELRRALQRRHCVLPAWYLRRHVSGRGLRPGERTVMDLTHLPPPDLCRLMGLGVAMRFPSPPGDRRESVGRNHGKNSGWANPTSPGVKVL